MFRVQESDFVPRFSWAMLILLAAVLAAASVTAWLVWMLHLERGLLDELLADNSHLSSDAIRLPPVIRIQFPLAILVFIILIGTGFALVLIRRRFLASWQSLREVKVIAHDILASMEKAVLTTNCNGIVTSINPRGCELFEVTEACVGRPLTELSLPGVALDTLTKEVLTRGLALSDRDLPLGAHGLVRRLRADCHLLHDTGGEIRGTVLHVRDVTNRILTEERMRRMERHLGLGSLATGLQHEIKNPLTALSLHVQLLEERLAEGEPDRQTDEIVNVLKTEVTRLNGVLETFRDFASFRELSLLPTNVRSLVDKVVRFVRPQAESQNVRISVEKADDLPRQVWLDAPRIDQVLLNLIINALEAMPQGGELALRAARSESDFRLEVADTGPGIPKDLQQRIFEPYFSTKAYGTGMGLAWSERIVEQHGGRIEFASSARETVFRILIPLSEQVSDFETNLQPPVSVLD